MQLSSISDDELVDIFGEIGMIDKPVHVLRFQKTLNEWNTNPQEIVANLSGHVRTRIITVPNKILSS